MRSRQHLIWPSRWGDGGVSKYSNGVVSGEDILSLEKTLTQFGIGKKVLSQHLLVCRLEDSKVQAAGILQVQMDLTLTEN